MGLQDRLIGLCMVPKKREDVGNTLRFPTIKSAWDKTGSMGLNGTMRHFTRAGLFFYETPSGSQPFESSSLLIENMATFGTDAD